MKTQPGSAMLLFFLCDWSNAHPHVFVDAQAEFQLDADQRLQALRISWRFERQHMKHRYFEHLEKQNSDIKLDLAEVLDQLAFDGQGLMPVITQDSRSKEILMFAWMNRQALEQTLETRRVTYWSRSRKQLWVKGETSGHTQTLVSMSFDCDGDAILCLVDQTGAACHTGRRACFYLKVDDNGKTISISDGF